MEGVLPLYRAGRRRRADGGPDPLRRPGAVGRGAGAARPAAEQLGLATEIVPGVSAFTAVAAHRRARADHPRGRPVGDPHPARGRQDADAAGRGGPRVRPARHHDGAVPVRRALRAARRRSCCAGGYPADTPVVVAYQATWPDELVVRCTVGEPGRRRSRSTGSGSTPCSWSARRWPPAAPAPTSTTPATSTASGRPPGVRAARRATASRPRRRVAATRDLDATPPRAARAGPAAHREGPAARRCAPAGPPGTCAVGRGQGGHARCWRPATPQRRVEIGAAVRPPGHASRWTGASWCTAPAGRGRRRWWSRTPATTRTSPTARTSPPPCPGGDGAGSRARRRRRASAWSPSPGLGLEVGGPADQPGAAQDDHAGGGGGGRPGPTVACGW